MANKARALMAALDDSDLRGLVSSIPGLAFAWAPLAKVGSEALDAGHARAFRAVRVHMARHPEAFYRALGKMAALVPDLANSCRPS